MNENLQLIIDHVKQHVAEINLEDEKIANMGLNSERPVFASFEEILSNINEVADQLNIEELISRLGSMDIYNEKKLIVINYNSRGVTIRLEYKYRNLTDGRMVNDSEIFIEMLTQRVRLGYDQARFMHAKYSFKVALNEEMNVIWVDKHRNYSAADIAEIALKWTGRVK